MYGLGWGKNSSGGRLGIGETRMGAVPGACVGESGGFSAATIAATRLRGRAKNLVARRTMDVRLAEW